MLVKSECLCMADHKAQKKTCQDTGDAKIQNNSAHFMVVLERFLF